MSDSLWLHESQHARLPVHHQLPEFIQTHANRVSDAIQPSHPLSSPSPPAPDPSQHQSLSQWVNSSHKVAKVLEFQLQHQSFQWTGLIYFRMNWLNLLAVQGTLWAGIQTQDLTLLSLALLFQEKLLIFWEGHTHIKENFSSKEKIRIPILFLSTWQWSWFPYIIYHFKKLLWNHRHNQLLDNTVNTI